MERHFVEEEEERQLMEKEVCVCVCVCVIERDFAYPSDFIPDALRACS